MGRIADAQDAFTEIYSKDLWGLGTGEWAEPREGEETEAERMAKLVRMIQDFLKLNDIKSVVEFGSGYWSYSKMIDWTGIRYDGFDVVQDIVDSNNRNYGSDTIRFHRVADGVHLPAADLVISKDVLQHLPTEHVRYYFDLFKKNFRFMLIANDVVPSDNLNGDTRAGGYRALRFELPPYNHPNAVLQTWVTTDFGVYTVKNFCLLYGTPDPSRAGAILRDVPESAASAPPRPTPEAAQSGLPPSILRALVKEIVVAIPPLARVTGFVLERVRDRRR